MTKNHLFDLKMNRKDSEVNKETDNLVDKAELNLWKRGFTPQAEIWNGRMAIVGIGITFILIGILKILPT